METITIDQGVLTPAIAKELLAILPPKYQPDSTTIYLPQAHQFFTKDGRIYLRWDEVSNDWHLWLNFSDLENIPDLLFWTENQISLMASKLEAKHHCVKMMTNAVKDDELKQIAV